jgi:hypothetical protein
MTITPGEPGGGTFSNLEEEAVGVAKETEQIAPAITEYKALGSEMGDGARMVKQDFSPKALSGDLKNPSSFRGAEAGDVKDWLNNNGWKSTGPTGSGGGEVFQNGNRGEQVRLMPGYPPGSRPANIKTGPYMEMSVGGKKIPTIPLRGNPTL